MTDLPVRSRDATTDVPPRVPRTLPTAAPSSGGASPACRPARRRARPQGRTIPRRVGKLGVSSRRSRRAPNTRGIPGRPIVRLRTRARSPWPGAPRPRPPGSRALEWGGGAPGEHRTDAGDRRHRLARSRVGILCGAGHSDRHRRIARRPRRRRACSDAAPRPVRVRGLRNLAKPDVEPRAPGER